MSLFRVLSLSLASSMLLFGLGFAEDDVVPDSATAVKFDFAHHCKVGDHTFRFEITTLADIIHALGSGVIRGNGEDAGGGEFGVEYVDGDYLIRFSSNAEMGGDDHQLEEIEVRSFSTDEKRPALPSLSLPVTFQFGSAGMSFADLVALLGPAPESQGFHWYEYSGKKPIKVSSDKVLDYDVSCALRVKVQAGKVAEIQLSHVTSY